MRRTKERTAGQKNEGKRDRRTRARGRGGEGMTLKGDDGGASMKIR